MNSVGVLLVLGAIVWAFASVVWVRSWRVERRRRKAAERLAQVMHDRLADRLPRWSDDRPAHGHPHGRV